MRMQQPWLQPLCDRRRRKLWWEDVPCHSLATKLGIPHFDECEFVSCAGCTDEAACSYDERDLGQQL